MASFPKPTQPASTISRRRFALSAAALATWGLSACGGGGDATTEPAEPQTFTLRPNSRVLDSTNTRLLAQDDTSMTLAGAAVAEIRAGDVLVSTLGVGALRKVLAVERLPNGDVRLATEEAALADAFSRFQLSFNRELTGADLGPSFTTGEPGLELVWVPNAAAAGFGGQGKTGIGGPSGSFKLNFKQLSLDAQAGISISGGASFQLQPEFEVSLEDSVGSVLPTLTYRAGLAPAYSHALTLSSRYGGRLARDFRREVALPPIVLATPPVTIVPYVVFSASASGTAAGKFSTTYTASVSGSAFVWRTAAGDGDASHSFVPLQEGRFEAVEAELKADVVPIQIGLEFRVYNVMGPQFSLNVKGTASGAYEADALTGQEGIRAKLKGAIGFKAAVGGKLGFVSKLFSKASGRMELISKEFSLAEGELFNRFFPFAGEASIVVRDNGNVPDDIFEVSLDDTVLGRTSKGGSGQFRIGSLRPGAHTLRLVTIEDDAPPGTWEVNLANGLSFSSGGTRQSGRLQLGSALDLTVIVPTAP